MNEEKLASLVAEIARAYGWEVAFHIRNREVVGVSVADAVRMDAICDTEGEMQVWGTREIDA